jgi:hypothetical protein
LINGTTDLTLNHNIGDIVTGRCRRCDGRIQRAAPHAAIIGTDADSDQLLQQLAPVGTTSGPQPIRSPAA